MQETLSMQALYEGVRLADEHVFEPAQGKFHDARALLAAAKRDDSTLDEEYMTDTIPRHLIDGFDAFLQVQQTMWQLRPGQENSPVVGSLHVAHLFDDVDTVLRTRVFLIDEQPLADSPADVQAETWRANALLCMLLGRTATAQAATLYDERCVSEAKVAAKRGDDAYVMAHSLLREPGTLRSLQVLNAMHAARHARLGDEELAVGSSAQRWLLEAAYAYVRGGNRHMAIPRSISVADVFCSRTAALQSVYVRP